MARNGWRAEDAILEIFKLGSDGNLDPKRRQCLALNKDGVKRCGWRCPLLVKFERCEERSKLVEKFQASKAPDDPSNFETDVMRFIELACCHQAPGPGHVLKMENAAADWFKAHSHEVPRTSLRSTRSDPVRDNSPMAARSVGARSIHTASTQGIKMRPYTRGRDEWQLRKAIEDDLEGNEFYRGRVYITVSSDLPGYVKIGYTTMSLENRFAYALKDCGIDLQPRYGSRVVPHAMRLERIVHEELAAYRYRFVDQCPFCIDRPGKRHQEFFGTTLEYARGVIEHWAGRLEEGMYEDGALVPAQRGELMRLATPEKIKERQMSLSPEPPSSRRANVSHGLPTPPQSPSPPVRKSYGEGAKSPTTPTRAQSKAIEAPSSPPASPKSPRRADETILPTVEQLTTSTPTVRPARKQPTDPKSALATSGPGNSFIGTPSSAQKAEVASVARPLPQTPVAERKATAGSVDSVKVQSQRKPLEREDIGSATYGGYAPYAGNQSYRGNGSYGEYASNSQKVNSGKEPKKGVFRKLLETLKLRRKKSV